MKISNMDFSQVRISEILEMTRLGAGGHTWSTFLFLKSNMDIKTGQLKPTIGDDVLNYETIAKRLGIHRTCVARAVKWLNKHGFIDTYMFMQLRGKVIVPITNSE